MIELIQACSPNMQLPIAQAIIKTESRFNPFAIGVNNGKRVRQPTSYQEAVATAKWLLGNGANIDIGYSQINSSNLQSLGLSVEQAFDPCTNITAMQTIYNQCFAKAGDAGLGNRMQRAFSCYNTGNMTDGFSNGYVNKATNNFNGFIDGSIIKYQQYHQQKYVPSIAVKKTSKRVLQQPISTALSNVNETKENTQAKQEQPVKVFLSWDVFKDF